MTPQARSLSPTLTGRNRRQAGTGPAISVVLVWRDDIHELERRLRGFTGRGEVELLLVRACSTAERMRLERSWPGLQIVHAGDQRLPALRQLGADSARGELLFILDDETAARPSWRDHLPAGILADPHPASLDAAWIPGGEAFGAALRTAGVSGD